MSAVYTQREADEAQIKQQVARIAERIRAKDLEGLRPIYATDIVSFDVEPPLQHVGVEAKLKNWANVFAVFRDADYEVRGLSVAVGDDVAFGHCFPAMPPVPARIADVPARAWRVTPPAAGTDDASQPYLITARACRRARLFFNTPQSVPPPG